VNDMKRDPAEPHRTSSVGFRATVTTSSTRVLPGSRRTVAAHGLFGEQLLAVGEPGEAGVGLGEAVVAA